MLEPKTAAALRDLCPDFATLYDGVAEQPLGRFSALVAARASALAPARGRSSELLLAELEADLGRYDRDAREAALSAFRRAPIVHMGPHRRTFTDSKTTAALLFADTIANAGSPAVVVWYGDSSASLCQKRQYGPGWIKVGTDHHRLFALTSRSDRWMTAAAHREIRINPALLAATDRLPLGAAFCKADERLERNPPQTFSAAIALVNEEHWAALSGESKPLLVQVDSGFVGRVVARHLADGGTPLTRILLDEEARTAWLRLVGRILEGPGRHFISWNTAFFWGRRGGRRVPLRLEAGQLVEEYEGHRATWDFDAASLVPALRQGRLIPNLFMVCLALSWLPRVLVTGGAYQVAYDSIARRSSEAGLRLASGEALQLAAAGDPAAVLAYGLLDESEPAVREAIGSAIEGLEWCIGDIPAVPTRRACRDLAVIGESSRWRNVAAEGWSGDDCH